MALPEPPDRVPVDGTDPDRARRYTWLVVLTVALVPHLGLFTFMLRYALSESDPGYVAIFAWLELILTPGGLLLTAILAFIRAARRFATAAFAGTAIGLLLIVAILVLIDARS